MAPGFFKAFPNPSLTGDTTPAQRISIDSANPRPGAMMPSCGSCKKTDGKKKKKYYGKKETKAKKKR